MINIIMLRHKGISNCKSMNYHKNSQLLWLQGASYDKPEHANI